MQGAQKLTALDASFLHLEAPGTHMHIGGVAVFEPSPLGTGRDLYERLVEAVEPRLDLMPRYRQRLALVPLGLDVPVWVDDQDFDIRNHVLHAALPRPGGDEQLQTFIARTFSRQLDRRRPLWEIYLVEGLSGGRWGLVTKTHHSLVDGISSLELVTTLLDTSPDVPEPPDRSSSWRPRDEPTPLDLVLGSLRDRLARPARLVSAARAVAGNPAALAASLRDTASGLAVMAQSLNSSDSVLNGPSGPARRYTFSRFPLEDFRTVKGAFGGTINDVVLAAVAGGLRHFLMARGLDPSDHRQAIKALCPVSIRDESERTALGNRLAMLLVNLPIGETDPARQMAKVRTTVDRLKARKQAVGADFLLNLAGFAPATLHAMVARASLRQMGFNIMVTNVPGPQFPLYCQGARLLEAFPVAFLYGGQRVAIAIFSYCGWLNFGYLGDAASMSDLPVLAQCVEASLRELVDEARGVPAQVVPPPRRRSARGS